MAHTPLCPTCQQPAADVSERTRRGVRYADCICPNAHPWQLHWLLPTVPIDPPADQEAS